MKIGNALVVYTKPKNSKEHSTLKHIQEVLNKKKIDFSSKERFSLTKTDFKNRDVVVTLGGDGTFLRASHFVLDNTPLIGVNLDPINKEGFFAVANRQDFREKLSRALKGRIQLKQLQRVQAFIGKWQIPEPALNEYYIASSIPYHTARYYLSVHGKKELQKSSGILVAAPAGTYAWVKSAGGVELPLFSRQFEYVIREPYCGKIVTKCGLRQGVLNPNKKITIEFEFGKGIIIADSTAREHYFEAGQKVSVKLSENPLHVIRFD